MILSGHQRDVVTGIRVVINTSPNLPVDLSYIRMPCQTFLSKTRFMFQNSQDL